MDEDFLVPWYALEPDIDKQKVYNRPQSAVFVYEPKSEEKRQTYTSRSGEYRSAELVFMEMAVRIRKALRNEEPFEWPADVYKELCTGWYCKQKEEGLRDIVYLCGSVVEEVTMRKELFCLVCWYDDGRADALILSQENKEGVIRPIISSIGVSKKGYLKPVFSDNAESFKAALQVIADYAPFDCWKERFINGLSIMNSESVTYSGQSDTFSIPEPYFKYFLSAQVTQLGYGMGSWYDLPMSGTESHKRVTDLFSAERSKALMYAINNC